MLLDNSEITVPTLHNTYFKHIPGRVLKEVSDNGWGYFTVVVAHSNVVPEQFVLSSDLIHSSLQLNLT